LLEWVNTAVEAFLNEVPSWQKHVVKIRSGLKGKIFRPTITLFVYLKFRRGTAIDVKDVAAALKACKEPFNKEELFSWKSETVIKNFEKYKSDLGLV